MVKISWLGNVRPKALVSVKVSQGYPGPSAESPGAIFGTYKKDNLPLSLLLLPPHILTTTLLRTIPPQHLYAIEA